jgi:hypothetical protein
MATATKSGWTPLIELDLETASTTAFNNAVVEFQTKVKDMPLSPLTLRNGWHDINSEIAEDFLKRNRHNRKAALATVKKYYYAMKAGKWHKTGQPVLINNDGFMEDAAHRCWASYFGKVSFPSYVIVDVPTAPDTFYYIDDCKPRRAADALMISGMNGLSGVVAGAVKLAWRYDNDAIEAFRMPAISRDIMTAEVVAYVQANPLLRETAHQMMGTYSNAVTEIGNAAVAVFFGWKASEHCDADVVDGFLSELGGPVSKLDDDSPVLALRRRLAKEADAIKAISKAHRLALVIKAFGFYVTSADKKHFAGKYGLHLRDNEEFPRIEEIPPKGQQSEAA